MINDFIFEKILELCYSTVIWFSISTILMYNDDIFTASRKVIQMPTSVKFSTAEC